MDEWIKHVINIHIDHRGGSPFWIDRAKRLNFDPLKKTYRRYEDLMEFGIMREHELAGRPLMDFIPKRFWHRRSEFIIGETGGTSGLIKTTAYSHKEFREAFVDNFVSVAKKRGFIEGVNWLYLGPTGPHIIGKAASACARAMSSIEPFMVDFDPRWFGKLPLNSIPRRRYVEHILSQAIRIIRTQHIEVIFATPKIIESLIPLLSDKERDRIRGVHFGGMPLDKDLYRRLHKEVFRDAVFISGYGNTLFGVALEIETDESYDITYYPFGKRLLFEVVKSSEPETIVNNGEEGRLIFSRFDETFMIINLLERDIVTKVESNLNFPNLSKIAIKNPRPSESGLKIKDGIY